jgi:hypothetical protein
VELICTAIAVAAVSSPRRSTHMLIPVFLFERLALCRFCCSSRAHHAPPPHHHNLPPPLLPHQTLHNSSYPPLLPLFSPSPSTAAPPCSCCSSNHSHPIPPPQSLPPLIFICSVAFVFARTFLAVQLRDCASANAGNARHTSHVTRHTSHVTRHTSHVTRHAPDQRTRTSALLFTAAARSAAALISIASGTTLPSNL